MSRLECFAIHGVGEVHEGDDVVTLFLDALTAQGELLCTGDLVTVTSKVISKAEGRVVAFDGTEEHRDRIVEEESVRTLRRRGPLRITETRHGFVNANAGVDFSNTDDHTAVLLPLDPDRSARRIRGELSRRTGLEIAVVVTDTMGRTWRNGVTDVAIGSAGLSPLLDLRGTLDANGRPLEVTEVAIVDEIAGAVNLVLPKDGNTPFAVVRGLDPRFFGAGSIADTIVRSATGDLFR